MHTMTRLATLLLLLTATSSVPADAPVVRFAKAPTVTRTAEGIRVDFAVSAPTDAAVYIEDAEGKVVCHLVAGVLGENPPPPLKPDSLEQSILWDGKDDFGRPALGEQSKSKGPFKVRVTLGTTGEFDGLLMYDPDSSGPVSSVAVGPGGTLYAFHRDGTANGNMGGHKIKIYSRDGKHLKALTPFPADIAPEKVRGLGVFRSPEGDLVPHIYNWETLSVYPDNNGVRGRDMPEYSAPAVDSKGRVYWLVKGPALVAVDADGGIPYDAFLCPRLLPDIKNLKLAGALWNYAFERPCLAVSSDDKYIYFAGLSTGAGDYRDTQPLPCVFRVSAETRGPAEVFVGKLGEAGKQKDLLTAPRGLAVANGMLYVADYGADRVVVFKESDRSFIG